MPFVCKRIGNAVLYCADCRDVLSDLPLHDAVVTDPPYGINEAACKNNTRGTKIIPARQYKYKAWDKQPVAWDQMQAIIAKGRNAIIFGGNYYPMPPSSCWLIWDKQINGDFADCELAWTNLKKSVRIIHYMWNGMIRENNEPRGDHPTQKPVGVMAWCIKHLPPETQTILDPYMGSGTTGVAAVRLGKSFTGIEIEREYFDAACRRLRAAQAQGMLRPPPPAIHNQCSLI
jgi:site-specific DNA-methyltransferase (adenine-specific)/modification methylase